MNDNKLTLQVVTTKMIQKQFLLCQISYSRMTKELFKGMISNFFGKSQQVVFNEQQLNEYIGPYQQRTRL